MARTNRRAGAVLLAAAAMTLAGCGGSKAPSVASVVTTTTTSSRVGISTAGPTTTSQPSSQSQLQQDALKYSECMRANGVPAFPDPSADGSIMITQGSGVDPRSPAFQAARAKCQNLMPGAGPLGTPGAQTNPAPQWLAHMVKVAACMRRHGVPDFPDPQTTVPSLHPGIGEVSDIQGVILVFPSSIDTASPQFVRAAAVCGFPLHDH